MADILRRWRCHNCERQFDAWEPNPPCTGCGCVRVSWVPAGGHVMGAATKTGDAELRALADCFRLPDLQSSDRTRGAKKIAAPAPASAGGDRPIQFAPGFAAAVPPDRAVCVPTGMTAKTSTSVGLPLQPNKIATAMRGNTRVEASHRRSGAA